MKSRAETEGLAIFENARALFPRGLSRRDHADRSGHRPCSQRFPDARICPVLFALRLPAGRGRRICGGFRGTRLGLDHGVQSLPEHECLRGPAAPAWKTIATEIPGASNARFLLAYHYLLAGHNDQAAAEFREVVRLEPQDQLSAQLLKGLTGQPAELPASATAEEQTTPVDQEHLVGRWNAIRPDGSPSTWC